MDKKDVNKLLLEYAGKKPGFLGSAQSVRNRKWLLLWDSTLTARELMGRLKLGGRFSVTVFAKRFGLSYRKVGRGWRSSGAVPAIAKQDILDLIEKGHSVKAISRLFDVKPREINKILKGSRYKKRDRYKLGKKALQRRILRQIKMNPTYKTLETFYSRDLTVQELANRAKTDYGTAYRFLRSRNLDYCRMVRDSHGNPEVRRPEDVEDVVTPPQQEQVQMTLPMGQQS